MELLVGESVARLLGGAGRFPVAIAARIAHDALLGLQAAHELTDERGMPLGLVHRDISPQNILVGQDGMTRVLDFGVAKAAHRLHQTVGHQLKGKRGYLAPEQIVGDRLDARVDVYAMGIVLWEMLSGRRLFEGDDLTGQVLGGVAPAVRQAAPWVPAPLEAVLQRALSMVPEQRFASAQAMAQALADACPLASTVNVRPWLAELAGEPLQRLRERVVAAERQGWSSVAPALVPPGAALPPSSPAPQDPWLRSSQAGSLLGIAAPGSSFSQPSASPLPTASAPSLSALEPLPVTPVPTVMPAPTVARRSWALGGLLLVYGGIWSIFGFGLMAVMFFGIGMNALNEGGIPSMGGLPFLVFPFLLGVSHLAAGFVELFFRALRPGNLMWLMGFQIMLSAPALFVALLMSGAMTWMIPLGVVVLLTCAALAWHRRTA